MGSLRPNLEVARVRSGARASRSVSVCLCVCLIVLRRAVATPSVKDAKPPVPHPSSERHRKTQHPQRTQNARRVFKEFGFNSEFRNMIIFGLSELAVAFISQAPLSGVKRSLIAFLRVCPRPRVFDLAPQE